MPRLIIGHVCDTGARIWVRASERVPFGFIRYRPEDGSAPQEQMLELEQRHNFTGVFILEGLTPDTIYHFDVRCGGSPTTPAGKCRRYQPNAGTFKTAPLPGTEREFTFVVASCNAHSLGPFASPDPAFERVGQLIKEKNASFMMHVGDQIYYDIPVLFKLPDLGEYRDKYHDAWGESRPTQAVLAQVPQYMILDDHEISNDFHNDMELNVGSIAFKKEVALKAYREYQHIHNPQTFGTAPLYYTFDYGQAGFFVMDARSERYKNPPGNQMIGQEQFSRLCDWLTTNPARLKFVVTSVPFIAASRNTDDKWADPPYQAQRDALIDFLAKEQVANVIFITGDMHNSYHAQMTIQPQAPGASLLVLHELMSSPVNHFNKAGPQDYLSPAQFTTAAGNTCRAGILPGTFFGDHSNVMTITVRAGEVLWEVHRTRKAAAPEKTGRVLLV